MSQKPTSPNPIPKSGYHVCQLCGKGKSTPSFLPSYSPFYPDGRTFLCYDCAEETVDGANLNEVDRLCQFCNMAFLPDEWRKLFRQYGMAAFRRYAESYHKINYYKYDWGEQNAQLMELAKKGVIEFELEELTPHALERLRRIWGALPENDIMRLEELYNSSLEDYTISSATEQDMLRKVCRLSLMVDDDFKEGKVDAPKIKQYESLLNSLQKVVEKNEAGGITSLGQIISFIERNGFQPSFYDGIPRDELDMMEQNIKEHISDAVMSAVNIGEIYEQRKRVLAKDEDLENLEDADSDEWEEEEENE